MPEIEQLLKNNREWAERIQREQPELIERIQADQTPRHFWIGCSDSRVPANDIVGVLPGQMFVHRNVANLISHTDLNCMSALQFAVEVLEVEHIIVCGHYGCAGVMASLTHTANGLVDYWLHQLDPIHRENAEELAKLSKEDRDDRLCELNVLAQVRNVNSTTIVQNALKRNQSLYVHGWIYNIHNCLIKELT